MTTHGAPSTAALDEYYDSLIDDEIAEADAEAIAEHEAEEAAENAWLVHAENQGMSHAEELRAEGLL